jgi:electron transport complex protein RnfC
LLVKKKDTVLKGQCIADAGGYVSARIHAPTSGTISDVSEALSPLGHKVPAVEITADGDDKAAERMNPITDWQNTPAETLRNRINDAGLVGMGGASFPTHVKLSPPHDKPIDTLIINGAECEPFLTCDHRLMLEETKRILTGTRIIAQILGVKQVFIALENNKPDAIKTLQASSDLGEIEVVALEVHYPQGAEKQLIYTLTGRQVPSGKLPMDVACVVQNVGTAAAVADAVVDGKPLYERVTTLSGHPVHSPGNWRIRIGTPLRDFLKMGAGVKEDPVKIIFGGPMTGFSVYSLDIPLLKNTSGIVLLRNQDIRQFSSDPCISCGACIDNCPMRLRPGKLSTAIERERLDIAEAENIMECIECGCCAYACPAHRPLVQHFKRAKQAVTAKRRAESQK